MTLPFSTTWPDRMGDLAGQPNHFTEKIWASLIDKSMPFSLGDYVRYHNDHMEQFGTPLSDYEGMFIHPKLHTIREDQHNRWRPGMGIHPVINNRTKDRFQFAPTLECSNVQSISITYYNSDSDYPAVRIGANVYYMYEKQGKEVIERLALNDGFPSVEAFFMWFDKDFQGKLIHWTDLKY